ncbi:rod shape-determining protein MreC [Pseudoxanthomonas japonensis]|uniref:rod shape-determining protein MreC n=1 Tax=Pseudoxanthomonas japonensis TaxID=69284 RepID=UPI00374866F0
MPSYAGPPVATRGEVASTLRLLGYLALTIALVILDHRGGWLSQVRAQANVVTQPLWWMAGLPGRVTTRVQDDAATRTGLIEENQRLRNDMLVANARLARLQTAAADNAQLRALLGVKTSRGLDVQLAPILDIDLAPGRQRLVLDAGSRAGALVGQSVIDAGGLMGQIIETTPAHATVLLLTDPDHAVPVVVARNGVRLIVYGRGRSDLLELADVPLNSGVEVGDVLVTSGLGGRFPAGFPVGRISALRPDDSHAFLVGDVTPAARLDRGRDVLLLKSAPPQPMPPADPSRFLPEAAAPAAGAAGTAETGPAASATQSPSPAGRGVGVRADEGSTGAAAQNASAPAPTSSQVPRPANVPTLSPTPLPAGEGLNGRAPAAGERLNRDTPPSPRPTTQEPQR